MFGFTPPTPRVRKIVIGVSPAHVIAAVLLPPCFNLNLRLVFWQAAIWIAPNSLMMVLYGRSVLPAI